MAKIAQHFTVTKVLPKNYGKIEFSGIVYNNNPEQYDIEDVWFHTTRNGQPLSEEITQFFHLFRDTTDNEFHHKDICELLAEWLASDEAKPHYGRLKDAA